MWRLGAPYILRLEGMAKEIKNRKQVLGRTEVPIPPSKVSSLISLRSFRVLTWHFPGVKLKKGRRPGAQYFITVKLICGWILEIN